MERPHHDVQTVNAKAGKNRTLGIAIAVGLNAAVVMALVLGLNNGALLKQMADIKATVEAEKVPPKAPPPPPPDLVKPPPPTAIVPLFTVDQAPAPSITTVVKAAPVKAAAPAPTELHAIVRTHTTPPYPSLSIRLGEQGTTLLKVTIGTDGNVTDASVEKTSGSDRLDQAAVEYVKAHWRWQPPTQEGKPIVAVTLVSIVWNLKDAQ